MQAGETQRRDKFGGVKTRCPWRCWQTSRGVNYLGGGCGAGGQTATVQRAAVRCARASEASRYLGRWLEWQHGRQRFRVASQPQSLLQAFEKRHRTTTPHV